MLSLFPQILFLAPLGTTVLRITVGLMILGVAWAAMRDRREVAQVRLPIIGHPPVLLISLLSIGLAAIGLSLLIGFGTQLAALGAIVFSFGRIALGRRYDSVCPIAYGTYALMIAASLSLLVTGAGAYGVDLPL